MKQILLGFLLALTVSACQDKAQPAKPPTTPKDTIVTPKHYLHLVGTIKDLPITMDLNFFKPPKKWDWMLQEGYYTGSYYYDKYQEPIEVWQYQDTTGVIILSERYAYNEENRFVGNFENGIFKGKWYDGYRRFSFPFELRPDTSANAVPLEFMTYYDAFELFKGKEESPVAEFSIGALWPLFYKDEATTTFLQKEFLKILAPDSLAATVNAPKGYFLKAKQNYFRAYADAMREEEESLGENEEGYFPNYSEQQDMKVIWNEDGLLSIGALWYEYSGGAHGNYGSTYYTFDVKNKALLTEEAIFQQNFVEKVAQALKNSAERTYDSDSQDFSPLEDMALDALKPNGNFYVTGGGIGYNFVPYEVGPYALG